MFNLVARKKFTKIRIVLLGAFIVLQVWAFSYINTDFLHPYYLVDFPSYAFIAAEPSRKYPLPSCDPFINTRDRAQFHVEINGYLYPKSVPFLQNKSINFTCLNSHLNVKKILLWNRLVGVPLMPIENGPLKSRRLKCPVSNCEITNVRAELNESDYILFHMRSPIHGFPELRLSHQKWVYVIYESQQHCPMCSRLDGLFNLSATFRRDSDITSMYVANSQLVWSDSQDKTNAQDSSDLTQAKTGFSAILISDCDTSNQRLEYIYELKRYIPVDLYGKCSTLK
jgi:hypothetical protein